MRSREEGRGREERGPAWPDLPDLVHSSGPLSINDLSHSLTAWPYGDFPCYWGLEGSSRG